MVSENPKRSTRFVLACIVVLTASLIGVSYVNLVGGWSWKECN